MKTEKIVKRFMYEDLGVPIVILNAPFKKIFGMWVLDINLNELQKSLLNALIRKSESLTGKELRFIRKYFEMTTSEFGTLLGVTHAAVLKWESDKSHMPPTTEKCVRLYAYDRLKAKNDEFRKFYSQISIENLAKCQKNRHARRIKIDASDKALVLV